MGTCICLLATDQVGTFRGTAHVEDRQNLQSSIDSWQLTSYFNGGDLMHPWHKNSNPVRSWHKRCYPSSKTCHRIDVVPEPRRPTSIPTQQSSRTSGMDGVMHARIRRTSSGSDKEGTSPWSMLSPRQFPTMDFCSIAKWDDPKCSWMITNYPSNVGSANKDLISHLCGGSGWKLAYRTGGQAGKKMKKSTAQLYCALVKQLPLHFSHWAVFNQFVQ